MGGGVSKRETSDDEWEGVQDTPKNDDIIYEHPLTLLSKGGAAVGAL